MRARGSSEPFILARGELASLFLRFWSSRDCDLANYPLPPPYPYRFGPFCLFILETHAAAGRGRDGVRNTARRCTSPLPSLSCGVRARGLLR